MALPPARHDALFRLIVADPGRAGALLRDYLPADIAALLDLDSPPDHVEGTAIDGEGRKTQADAIFRVRLRDGSDARVYILLEHKSTVDARTPVQLLRYMLRLWIAELDRGDAPDGKLSPIIPLVLYHGQGPWTPPLSLQEMIRAPKGMEALRRHFGHYTMHDLGKIAPAELSRDRFVRSSLFALAHDGRVTLTAAGEELLAAGIADTELGRYHLEYIAELFALSLERLFAARRRTGEDLQEMEALVGTIAETWLAEGEARGKAVGIMEGRAAGIAEGEARGKAVGIAEGKAEAVLRLVRLKFGDIPTDLAAQVRDASSDALDAWLEALITAESIDAVFAHRSAH